MAEFPEKETIVETKEEIKEEKPSYKDTLLRTVAIIGLVAIIVLGAWGVIELTFNLPNFLGGIGSSVQSIFSHPSKPGTEAVVVSTPQYVYTGEPFTVSWTHENPGAQNYGYTLSYSCTSGLSIQAPTPTGKLATVPCGTPFNYTNATANLPLTPKVVGPAQLSTTITVSAISLTDGSVTATGSTTVVVLPPRNVPPSAATTTPAKPAMTYKPAPHTSRYSNPTGIADLSVQILSVTPRGNGLDTMQFVIQNIGTKVAPYGWTFDAQLPVGYPYTYHSPLQRALYPGDKIVYTLTFSTNTCITTYQTFCSPYPASYNNTVTIIANPTNRVVESNTANNTATAPVPGLY